MALSAPTIIDVLKASKSHWTALGDAEVELVIRTCTAYSDGNWGKTCQMLAAYFYIASKRDSRSWTASVVDEEVASVVPRLRKPKSGSPDSSTIGADAFRKGAKRDLQACGLLDFKNATTRNGRMPTVYSFPALQRMLSAREGEPGSSGIKQGDYSECGHSAASGPTPGFIPSLTEQLPALTPVHPAQSAGVTPTSLGRELQERIGSSEEGSSHYWHSDARQEPRACPDCGSPNYKVEDPEHFICGACEYRFDIDGYAW